MRPSAITAARRVSAPSSREITAAASRALTPSAKRDFTTAGNFAHALPSAWTSLAASISSPSSDGFAGPQAQEIAGGERPDHAARLIDHAEMAHVEPAHSADGAIDEGIRRDHGERVAHDSLDRHRECIAAMAGHRPQNITLGDDAGLGRRRAAPSVRSGDT